MPWRELWWSLLQILWCYSRSSWVWNQQDLAEQYCADSDLIVVNSGINNLLNGYSVVNCMCGNERTYKAIRNSCTSAHVAFASVSYIGDNKLNSIDQSGVINLLRTVQRWHWTWSWIDERTNGNYIIQWICTNCSMSEWVTSCLTAHQHNTGYSVPLTVERTDIFRNITAQKRRNCRKSVWNFHVNLILRKHTKDTVNGAELVNRLSSGIMYTQPERIFLVKTLAKYLMISCQR